MDHESSSKPGEPAAASAETTPSVTKRRGVGNRKHNAKDDAAEAMRAERREKCVRLRGAGYHWREVAQELGYCTHVEAMRDFKRAILERPHKAVDEYRAEADAVLADIIATYHKLAVQGDEKAAQVVIKAIATNARIQGFDAPQKTELTGKDGGPMQVENAADDILSRLARIATGAGATADNPKPESN